ncbi:hypothetical protein LCGC14_2791210 [marine sediment metagenome]|uniref:Uncharacterized protein n=1 Tax=marine sediment metagenome TaxID=412755 RepID=A0A0F8YQE4_9ZZZZ
METPPKDTSEQEICTIKIMFPVTNDEQAIGIRRDIKNMLSSIPDSRIQFSLVDVPKRPQDGMGI